jgi:hypothetical protein
MSKITYINFPIQLLQGFMINSNKVLDDVINYVIYEHSLKLEYGTEQEKIKASAKHYNLTLGSVSKTLKNGSILYDSLPVGSVKVGINLDVFWDFYKNDKKDFDKICLLGFLGIKSIIGPTSVYKKTTNHNWLARMDGKACKVNDFRELSDEVRKYSNEYQTKKIKAALQDGWGLCTYSRYTRGFYVSFKLPLKQLIYEAEKRRASTKHKQRKDQEKELVKEILEQLKVARL